MSHIPPPAPSRAKRMFRTFLRRAMAIALMAVAAGCAVLPSRGEIAAPDARVSRKALAEQIAVSGSSGRQAAPARQELLAQLESEGKPDLLRHQLAVMAADGPVELIRGNDVRVLVDGPQTFAALFAAIEKARRSILIETYIVEDAGPAERLAALLLRKRAAGVNVNLMFDAVGSIGTDQAYFERLRAGGVRVCRFNPVNPLDRPGYWSINQRDHRKVTVIDGATAFVGGINISRVYSSGSSPARGGRTRQASVEDGWRDTHLALQGPAALTLEKLVREAWVDQGCEGEFPTLGPAAGSAGDKVVRIIASSPDGRPSEIYRSLLGAIDHARRSVHLTMAYFAPGPEMVAALVSAARRGVDVHLILPSMSDFTPVLNAGRSYYAELLEAGVKIAELQDAVLHSKTAVIDGVWSTIGSSNMDWRSLVSNNEANVVVLGDDFAREMERMFERDLAQSEPVDATAWATRPLPQRLKEWFARVAERWL
jgi:cardiolipin synthase